MGVIYLHREKRNGRGERLKKEEGLGEKAVKWKKGVSPKQKEFNENCRKSSGD